jgi:hypothetical protein
MRGKKFFFLDELNYLYSEIFQEKEELQILSQKFAFQEFIPVKSKLIKNGN